MADALDVLSDAAILDGRATDAYFLRTEETLAHAGRNPTVVAEVTLDQFPTDSFDVFAGIEDAAAILEGLPVDAWALREGQLFDGGPVMRIEGPYQTFARYETAVLGVLSQASGFATRALEARLAAPDSTVLSFGSRHLHPAIAPVLERAALVGGLDGISNVGAGEAIDREAGGTMPHALMLVFGREHTTEAWQAFDEAVDESVPRIALCDTFTDESIETLDAAEALGSALDGVRIDTTGSRRGDFRHILREVRFRLDAAGHESVDIFASGGLDPAELRELRDVADGFGIGGYVTGGSPLDFSLDIVAVDGEPISKRGKLPGVKQVYRTANGGHHVQLERHEPPEDADSLLSPLVRDGEIVREFDIDEAGTRSLEDATRVGFEES
jgi:nicotinate phosphoribosyltransferase